MILRNTTSQPPGWTNLHTILYEHKGMESPLPYLSPLLKGHKLLAGANFASAGIGILNDTEVQFTNTVCRISFFGTITSAVKYNLYMETTRVYFEQYHTQLVDIIGAYGSRQVVNEGMVLISLGGNDFVNNYYLVPFSAGSHQYYLPDYVCFIVSEHRNFLSVIWLSCNDA